MGAKKLLGQPLGHVLVGHLDFGLGGARVVELIAGGGVLQVAPDSRHVRGDVVVTVLLGHHLKYTNGQVFNFTQLVSNVPSNLEATSDMHATTKPVSHLSKMQNHKLHDVGMI